MGTAGQLAPLLVSLFLTYTGWAVMLTLLVDVQLNAFCPGRTECSKVIYLAGVQDVIIGIGSTLMAPVLGVLSDKYGRKPMFTMVVFASVAPALVLAYSREAHFVYAWWVLNLIGSVIKEAGIFTVLLACVADIVKDPSKRASLIGVSIAFSPSGMLAGTLLGRFQTAERLFWISALCHVMSTVSVSLFLVESHPKHSIRERVSKETKEEVMEVESLIPLIPKAESRARIRKALDVVFSSPMLRTIAAVTFMANLGQTVSTGNILYYLKAVYDFGKDDYSLFLTGVAAVSILGQMIIYPFLALKISDKTVLLLGLLGSSISDYLFAIAWARWVLYVALAFEVFTAFISPAIGSIVSKAATEEEQGSVQGLIESAKKLANFVGPLAITPVTAAFLSDNPPFRFPGFTMLLSGVGLTVGFVLAFAIPNLSSPPEASPAAHRVGSPEDQKNTCIRDV